MRFLPKMICNFGNDIFIINNNYYLRCATMGTFRCATRETSLRELEQQQRCDPKRLPLWRNNCTGYDPNILVSTRK